MDEEGEMQLPVKDTKHLQYDIVGSHLQNYDFMINLAHFKGHAMGGFSGVLKNQSIGVDSTAGKLYIHSGGKSKTRWTIANQDNFHHIDFEMRKIRKQFAFGFFCQKKTESSYFSIHICN